jgi:hypothetical protein
LGIASFGHRLFILKKLQLLKPATSVQVSGAASGGMGPPAPYCAGNSSTPQSNIGGIGAVGAGGMAVPRVPVPVDSGFKNFNLPDDAGSKISRPGGF